MDSNQAPYRAGPDYHELTRNRRTHLGHQARRSV